MKKIIIFLIAILFNYNSFAQMGFGMVLKGDATTGVEIDRVGEKSGAELAGMKAGDVLVSVNGKSLAGKNYIEAAALLKEQPDKNNKLKFTRNGKEMEVVINKTPLQMMQGTSACLSGNCLNGKGKLESKNGRLHYIYDGEFKDGNRDGEGVLTYLPPQPAITLIDDDSLRVEKFDGVFNAGRFVNGDIYVRGKKIKGKLNGKLNSDNQLDGEYVYTNTAGKKETITFDNGELVANTKKEESKTPKETTLNAKNVVVFAYGEPVQLKGKKVSQYISRNPKYFHTTFYEKKGDIISIAIYTEHEYWEDKSRRFYSLNIYEFDSKDADATSSFKLKENKAGTESDSVTYTTYVSILPGKNLKYQRYGNDSGTKEFYYVNIIGVNKKDIEYVIEDARKK